MATPFTGNATITAGNGTSLLAVSNLIFAGCTTVRANGSVTAWFDQELMIVPSDPANFTILAAANATQAGNVIAGVGRKNVSGGVEVVSPGWVMDCVAVGDNANVSRADAGNVYVATSANQTLTIKGY
jgi:hypothetical protein